MAQNFEQYEIPVKEDKIKETVGGFVVDEGGLDTQNLEIDSGGPNIAKIKAGDGANSGGINAAGTGTDIVFWAGSTHSNRSTAPFRVNAQGDLTATSVTISGIAVNTKGAFGGDGSDDALSISSGTTTIDLANAKIVTKNYTSISITGTGKLTFSNPHSTGSFIILKSQGDVTLTSSTAPMLDASGMGAAAGTGGVGNGTDGTDGTTASTLLDTSAHFGGAGKSTGQGAAGAIYGSAAFYTISAAAYRAFGQFVAMGSGGGGGRGGATSDGGNGGRGGGSLIVECGGAINFTTTSGISTAGKAGSDTAGTGGPGGGGGAGSFICYYDTSTAITGTVTDSGGNGGTGGTVQSGGGGGSYGGAGAAGTSTLGGGGGGTAGAATNETGGSGVGGVFIQI